MEQTVLKKKIQCSTTNRKEAAKETVSAKLKENDKRKKGEALR